MLSNYWLSLLAILCFTSFTSTYAELAEWALYKDDGSHPSLPSDEKALIAVLDPAHSKRSPPVSLAESTTDPNPNFATLNRRYIGPNPNGQCPKPLYSDKEDDRRCDRRFAGPVTDQSKLYAAKSTTCASTITRRLNCQLCYGFRVDNPSVSFLVFQKDISDSSLRKSRQLTFDAALLKYVHRRVTLTTNGETWSQKVFVSQETVSYKSWLQEELLFENFAPRSSPSRRQEVQSPDFTHMYTTKLQVSE